MPVGAPTKSFAGECNAPLVPDTYATPARNHNFDYLRLFLAVEVVTQHLYAGLMRGDLWIPIPPVAVFVALSGFLIPQSLERSRNLRHFAWKRALRTLPALVPLFIVIGIALDLKHVERAFIQYISAGYHSLFQGCPLPLWSLIVEDGLYVALALLFVVKLHRNAWATTAIIGALMAARMFTTDAMFDYRFLQTSIAFFVGNLVFIWKDQLARLHWIVPAALLGPAIYGWHSAVSNYVFPLLVGCTLVLVMRLPRARWGIPDLSYSVYIWHAPIMLALLGPWAMPRDASWMATTVALTLLAAVPSWYLVEKPALRLKDWRLGVDALPLTDQSVPTRLGEVKAAA